MYPHSQAALASAAKTYDASRYVDSESEIGSIAEKRSETTEIDKVAASEGYRLAGLDRIPGKHAKTATTEYTQEKTVTPPVKPTPTPAVDTGTVPVSAAATSTPATKSLARKVSDFIPEWVWRNFAILMGACLGALYEVATMPTTVSNFSKVVYATTGYLEDYLPRGYSGALSAVDFYAMCADVVSAIIFFCLNVITAIFMVLVTVHFIRLFTGYGESALNFVCIPFTWTYALKAAKELAHDFHWSPATHELYGAALCGTVVVVEIFEFVAPVVTRGLCLGVCFSLFAADLLRFAAGFLWVLGLLIATWTLRGILRLALRIVSNVFPPVRHLTHALPSVALVPGFKKAGAGLVSVGAKAAGAAGKGIKAGAGVAARGAGKGLKAGVNVTGEAAKMGKSGIAVAGAGAKVGSAAAKGTVMGIVAGTKGGVSAGLAAGKLGVKGTVLAGKIAANAPGYAWRSAGKIRSFVKLAAVRAEAALDPVAPKTKATLKKKGGFGEKMDKMSDDRIRQRLKLN